LKGNIYITVTFINEFAYLQMELANFKLKSIRNVEKKEKL